MDEVLRYSNHNVTSLLNEYFSVFTVERAGSFPISETSLKERASNLTDIKISSEVIEAKLRNLSPHKSPCPDAFLPRALLETKSEVALYIAHIFNLSLRIVDVLQN